MSNQFYFRINHLMLKGIVRDSGYLYLSIRIYLPLLIEMRGTKIKRYINSKIYDLRKEGYCLL